MKNILRILIQILLALVIFFIGNILLSFIYSISYTLTAKKDISYLLSYLILVIILFIINHKKLIEDFKNIKKDYKGKIVNILVYSVIFYILMYLSNIVLYFFTGSLSENEMGARELFLSSPLIMFFTIGIIAPIFEEIILKYPYRDIKIKQSIKLALYTFVFSIMHIPSFNNIKSILYVFSYMFLCLTISYSFFKTNNIYGSIIVHILNNSLTLLLLLM